jgi:predicted XRE-type DNA-binding protein
MVDITKGSNNIFRDLGFEEIEARALKRKAETVIAIERAMKVRQLSQVVAAREMGVSRPRLNQMLHGKVEGISLDRMLLMADALGVKAHVKFAQPRSLKLQRRAAKAKAAAR